MSLLFFYFYNKNQSSFSKSWTPIIPNSQLIIYPETENPDKLVIL